jgi:hypothetical protein
MKTKEAVMNKRTADRVAHAPAGKDHDKIAEILAMQNADKRAAALYDAGYCDSNRGTCHAGPGDTIAKRKETASFCEFHAGTTTRKPKAEPKAKVTELKPKKAKVAAPRTLLRKAAGPPAPKNKDGWTPAQELLIEGFKADKGVTRMVAIRELTAAKLL